MKSSVQTLRSESFLHNGLLLYINRATEDFTLPLHNHEFLELAFIAEGSGFHHIGNEVHKVRKGELCYIPIGMSHVFRPVSTDLAKHPLIVYNCVFSPELLTKLAQFSTDSSLQHFFTSLNDGSSGYFTLLDDEGMMERLFLSMHREYTFPRGGSVDYLHTQFLQLLIVVHRLMQGDHPDLVLNEQHTRFDQLLSYIHQHYAEELTLSHLAAMSLWSERHLQRLFHQHTSQPFLRYLQFVRIQKSCELLRDSQLKIRVIAEMVGYKDMGAFLAVFKRIVSMTPSQYRKRH